MSALGCSEVETASIFTHPLAHTPLLVDLETKMMEELSTIRAQHLLNIQVREGSQREEYQLEKSRIETTKESIKIMEVQMQNNFDLKKLLVNHKNQIRQLKRGQKARKQSRKRYWANILEREVVSAIGSQAHSQLHSQSQSQAQSQAQSATHSNAMSRQLSSESLHRNGGSEKSDGTGVGNLNFVGDQDDEKVDYDAHSQHLEAQKNQAAQQLAKMYDQLESLAKKHKESMNELKKSQRDALVKREEEFQKEMVELQWKQDVESKDFQKDNDTEIAEALAVQEHELELDSQIRGAETRALQERRVLNTLLDTIIDGVISISPTGVIMRFNSSAEKMFGYPSSEIIGKNIKQLMPAAYARNHDQYLYNYLSTGIKKVIGTGRAVTGTKKDGTDFPIQLSISEVIEEGFHLFTAIVRDLTDEVAKQKIKKAEEDCVPQLMWRISTTGNLLFANNKLRQYAGLTEDSDLSKVNVLNKPFVHPDDVAKSKKAFNDATLNMTPFDVKRRVRDVNGIFR